MNRVDFIDSDRFKEKLKNPGVAIGQRWQADMHHDFGNGPIAYAIKVMMQEPLGVRWLVNFYLPTGGQIPNGHSNTGYLTEEQIKENFEFITTPIETYSLPSNNVSGTWFMGPQTWS